MQVRRVVFQQAAAAIRSCRISTRANPKIQKGDVVLLRTLKAHKQLSFLSKPLIDGLKIDVHKGSIDARLIIGKDWRTVVKCKGGELYRLFMPRLDEYVALTPRLVTPIYAPDAALITSLLDIHVRGSPAEPLATAREPYLEILEAGTGHGSLTLHLARAIQAANPIVPEAVLREVQAKVLRSPTADEDDKAIPKPAVALAEYKTKRAAVVHSIDNNASNSHAARKFMAGFRQGLYSPNIDFHIGDVGDYIDTRMQAHGKREEKSSQQIFSHIILDLPDAHDYLFRAADALKDDGVLIIFCPSVTQIARSVQTIRENKLPLSYTNVLELGIGMSGGKPWDVRAVKLEKLEQKIQSQTIVGGETSIERRLGFVKGMRMALARWLVDTPRTPQSSDERWETIARPHVGHRIIGGGFVGVWHRKKNWAPHELDEAEMVDLHESPAKKIR